MKKIESYKDLLVWQKGMDLAEDCFRLVEIFAKQQQFLMNSQIWRAAYSVPSNIAKGASRGSTREYMRFLWISHRSLRELETHLILSNRVTLMETAVLGKTLLQCKTIGKCF